MIWNPRDTKIQFMIVKHNFGLLLFCFCLTAATPCFALQSGSRSAAARVGGSATRSVSPVFTEPSISGQRFTPPSESFSTLQNPQTFADPYNASGVSAEPFDFSGNGQVAMPQQSGQPSGSGGASSPGIPASALNDPIFAIHDPTSFYTVDHSAWDFFLSRYVTTDSFGVSRVAYGHVSAQDLHALQCYLQHLQSIDTRTLNRDEQLAFWFNLYNARTILFVLENYPIRSVRQIKQKLTDFVGPFDDPGVVTVLGKPLSLNDIESGIIRPVWQDPRIHYALNCASYGCPNLAASAWTGRDIDARLNSAAYQYINSDRAFKVGLFGLRASKIYKWYGDDFGGGEEGVLNHARQFANQQTLEKLDGCQSIRGYFYGWSLNDSAQGFRLLESIRR